MPVNHLINQVPPSSGRETPLEANTEKRRDSLSFSYTHTPAFPTGFLTCVASDTNKPIWRGVQSISIALSPALTQETLSHHHTVSSLSLSGEERLPWILVITAMMLNTEQMYTLFCTGYLAVNLSKTV